MKLRSATESFRVSFETFATEVMQAQLVQRQHESCDDSHWCRLEQPVSVDAGLHQRLTVSLLLCAQVSTIGDKQVIQRLYF